ncbi:hypothetical protein [Enterobacter phage vB_ExiM_F5M1E]|nr:hypothetical protein [Enterobacter phage vB_ExiM_F1M1E]UNA02988.1 hypothetical protein [Enterobacter phage vB_ExiM_F2M1E]UNA03309.1 hypothetical protein [Enterobacter phage vB_ExiM_F4M1E]UNA03630.1 hypothetical protein [Enterobacter phage vB_ExiM_F5M1E]UNA03950.1 hypothetical protein [Pantoea phage vB_PdiM_F5M2A]
MTGEHSPNLRRHWPVRELKKTIHMLYIAASKE